MDNDAGFCEPRFGQPLQAEVLEKATCLEATCLAEEKVEAKGLWEKLMATCLEVEAEDLRDES